MTLVQPFGEEKRATKPDHWESVTRIKLPAASKAHKPADSGLVVGNTARRCSLSGLLRRRPTASGISSDRVNTLSSWTTAPFLVLLLAHSRASPLPQGFGSGAKIGFTPLDLWEPACPRLTRAAFGRSSHGLRGSTLRVSNSINAFAIGDF